jgi:hypothetical protein
LKLQWLINGLLDKDDYDLLMWLRWYSQKNIECIDCIKTRAMMSKQKPDCFACGLPIAILLKKFFPEKGALKNEIKN